MAGSEVVAPAGAMYFKRVELEKTVVVGGK
jgi:hypothetical protein